NTIRSTGGDDAGIEVRPLIPRAGAIDADTVVKTALADPFLRGDLIARGASPIDADTVVKTALADPFLRGDLIARDASVVSLVVNFDEDRVDRERAQPIGGAPPGAHCP